MSHLTSIAAAGGHTACATIISLNLESWKRCYCE